MTDSINITTTNEDLYNAFQNLNIEGVECLSRLEVKDFHFGKRTFAISLRIIESAAAGVLAYWICTQMVNKPESKIQINNYSVTENNIQIYNNVFSKCIATKCHSNE